MSRTRNDALAPLGRHMEERRRELGMTLRQVAAAGGLSVEALRSVRYGESIPNSLTRAGIERALQWEPGSVDRILADGTPRAAAGAGILPAGEDAERQKVIAGVRALYPGDDVAELIMTQWNVPLEVRQQELHKWRGSAGEARALHSDRNNPDTLSESPLRGN